MKRDHRPKAAATLALAGVEDEDEAALVKVGAVDEEGSAVAGLLDAIGNDEAVLVDLVIDESRFARLTG